MRVGVICNLPDGVVVMRSYSFRYDVAVFDIGDTVIVMIQCNHDRANEAI